MDERRFQLSLSIILVIFLFSLLRVVTSTNPIYSIAEPAVSWLNKVTKDFGVATNPEVNDSAAVVASVDSDLEQENEELRKQLRLIKDASDVRSAEIIRRDMFGFNKTAWLNVGSSDGISVNDVAETDGFLYGIVSEVYVDTAAVTLLTDPTFRATVVSGKDKHGIAKVDHGSVIVDLLPSKELADNSVITDGLDDTYPAGIKLGNLGVENGQTGDVFGRYSLVLPFNLVDVDFVQVTLRSES